MVLRKRKMVKITKHTYMTHEREMTFLSYAFPKKQIIIFHFR